MLSIVHEKTDGIALMRLCTECAASQSPAWEPQLPHALLYLLHPCSRSLAGLKTSKYFRAFRVFRGQNNVSTRLAA